MILPSKPSPSDSFRSWLAGEGATESKLKRYLTLLGEWWNSEFKAATTDIDYGLRKSVCAFANTRGGEVFLGVEDDRTLGGTIIDETRLEQTLKQPRAVPADWYLVDLNLPVSHIVSIDLANQPAKRVHVLEVKPKGIPAFLLEKDGELVLYLRQGSSSMSANGFRAMEWQRQVTREEVLRNLYLELKTLSRTIGVINIGIGINLGLTVPYLTARLEDGTLYRLLTDKDLLFLFGRARGSSGYEGGIYRDLYQARYEIEKEMNLGLARHEVDREIEETLGRAGEGIRSRAESLRNYLNQNGIAAD